MPNNQRVDYVAPHRHAGDDINGLAVFLFPPTQRAVGTTSGPTTNSSSFSDLAEMTLTITPPDRFQVWEAKIVFEGNFQSTPANGVVQTVLVQDGVDIPNTTRTASCPDDNTGGTAIIRTVATVYMNEGVSSTVKVQWRSIGAAAVMTARGTSRRLEITLRPYQPAAV